MYLVVLDEKDKKSTLSSQLHCALFSVPAYSDTDKITGKNMF